MTTISSSTAATRPPPPPPPPPPPKVDPGATAGQAGKTSTPTQTDADKVGTGAPAPVEAKPQVDVAARNQARAGQVQAEQQARAGALSNVQKVSTPMQAQLASQVKRGITPQSTTAQTTTAADKPNDTGEIGRGPDGRFGDDKTGVAAAALETLKLAGETANPGTTAAQRAAALAAVEQGAVTPDPESRLGAYAATKGYPPGTVGHAVHNAIGTIYGALGTYGEEKIGRVFNSPEARALYSQPVDGPAGKKMAQLEHQYWSAVRAEDPASPGGNLGAMFDPAARDFLQRNIFSRLP